MMKLLRVPCLLPLLLVGCGGNEAGVWPEISSFLSNFPSSIGTPVKTEDLPNWEHGARQRVIFDNGKNLIFYLRNGRVVALYQDVEGRRRKVWSQSEDTP